MSLPGDSHSVSLCGFPPPHRRGRWYHARNFRRYELEQVREAGVEPLERRVHAGAVTATCSLPDAGAAPVRNDDGDRGSTRVPTQVGMNKCLCCSDS